MSVCLELLAAAAGLPRQHGDDADEAMDVDDNNDDEDTAAITATTTTTTAATTDTADTATATAASVSDDDDDDVCKVRDSLSESIPWPDEATDTPTTTTTTTTSTTSSSSDGVVCRWRVGRSCHNARWLFLRFSLNCNCLSFIALSLFPLWVSR